MTTTRSRRKLFVSLVAALASVLLPVLALAGLSTGAAASPTQNPAPSTSVPATAEPSPTTAHDLGDGVTTVPPITASKSTATVTKNATVRTASRDSNRVWAVVAALVLVAVALSVLTVLYVRHTRPEPAAGPRPSVLDGGVAPAASTRPRGRSMPEPAGRR